MKQNNEKVLQLLRQPTLAYIRELNRITDSDPEYLMFHSGSVALRVKKLLAQQDVQVGWDISERQLIGAVKEAIVRLRSFEK